MQVGFSTVSFSEETALCCGILNKNLAAGQIYFCGVLGKNYEAEKLYCCGVKIVNFKDFILYISK